MSKKFCIQCGQKKGLMKYNYAGFVVQENDIHPYPERIMEIVLPGNKDEDFLCADCANRIKVYCSVHGLIDDCFTMGIPPRCSECVSDKKAEKDEKKLQSQWENLYPETVKNERLKLFCLRGALAQQLLSADNKVDEKELDAIQTLGPDITGRGKDEEEAFLAGYIKINRGEISSVDLLDLCQANDDDEGNKATILMLLKLAAADGYLDKSEYLFIRKISQYWGFNLPTFDSLAEKLGLDKSNVKMDKALKTTAGVAVGVGAGVLMVGGIALSAFLTNNKGSSGSAAKSGKPANFASPSKSGCTVPSKENIINIRKGTSSSVLLNIYGNNIRECTSSSVLFNIEGNNIRKGTSSMTLLNVSGNNIRKGTSSTVLLNISGNNIREGTSSKVLFNISGNNIRKDIGSSTLYNTTSRCNTQELAAILLALNEL